ncbi:putative DNA polymerase [Vibrio phage vB_VmeM-32]|nr:putative DNA polymerase [Vibrio phage vB_VmeM-32]
MRVWDNEGKRKYNSKGELDYKLKIMGLETQKSSTPPFASTSLKKSIDVILMGNESKLHEYVQHVLSEYPKQDYSEIASVISVNNIEKYSDAMGNPLKGSSAQVKASLAFNNLAKHHAAVDPIKSGEKVQMLILKQPNPTHADKIAYPSGEVLPDDFGIDFSKWIDYRAMSQDHFLSPLQSMCDAIGWETEKRIKLNAVLDI